MLTLRHGSDAVGGRRQDLIVAALLASILSLCWAVTDWQRLGHLLLPDPDDIMRLAQVRDWIGGQGINDWTQHRMGPPTGAAMHWSRINDVGIAAIILAVTPILGRFHAELAAVLLYPALLFACAIYLSARIGRLLWGGEAGLVAAVLTALAYPGTTVFIPGRIDHHALQVVLIQIAVFSSMRPARGSTGAVIGLAAALSLIVGLETTPQVAALVAFLALAWVIRGQEERQRLFGFGVALGGTTLFFLLFLRPEYWSAALCDAFTPASSTGTSAVAACLVTLALLTRHLHGWRARLMVGAVLGGCALIGTLLVYPACVAGPYGSVDPFLRENFLPNIDEAAGIFRQRPVRIVAFGGLMATACLVSIWIMVAKHRRWMVISPLAGVIILSGLTMLAQVRGVYIGAPLAAPMLAVLILGARRCTRGRSLLTMLAWLSGAGMAYAAGAEQVEAILTSRTAAGTPGHSRVLPPQVLCSRGEAWKQVDKLPPSKIMAGTTVAAFVVGATHHSTVGAGYHRNDTGNMAVYRFFLGSNGQARRIASDWRTEYVLYCPGDFEELNPDQRYPQSVVAALRAGRTPDWLEPIPLHGTPMRLYHVR